MRDILQKHPHGRIKVLVVWSLIRTADSRRAAESASGYLPDPRAEHFWDLWNFVVKLYGHQLRFPPTELAWNLFVVYKPHLIWRDQLPEPTTWMQALNIEHGPKYNPKLLQAELEKWLR